MKQNPILALIAMAASAMSFTPSRSLPRTSDGKSPIPVDPTDFDLQRIEEAKSKRERRAAKKAANVAKSKAGNYR